MLLIIFSPLIVLAVPYFIIQGFYESKKIKKQIEEIKKRNIEMKKSEMEEGRLNRYCIAFKDLPFSPDEKQVIYVENTYDEKVNNFIKENYDRLVTEFEKNNLEFVYLPLYFNVELEEKIRYYAPYITERENITSSYMLDYMLRPENREYITASLLFRPQKREDDWVFSALYMDDISADVSEIVQKVYNAFILQILNRVEFQIVRPKKDSEIIRFREKLKTDVINEPIAPYGTNDNEATTLQEDTGDIRFREVRNNDSDDDILFKDGDDDDILFRDGDDDSDKFELDDETAEELAEIYIKLQDTVKSLRLKGIALGVIHKFIDELEPISPLLITEDLRLFLPLYNNIEIELSAQKKALYFLFLNHPEGIVLQHLENYHNELINYYKQTNNGILTQKMEERIRKLETYGNNQLHVVIARIREAFCTKFDERLARRYFISGKKGQPYRISLDSTLVEWE